MSLRRCSFLQEAQLVLADLELVAVLQPARLDALAVEKGAVQAPLVLDEERTVLLDEHGVLARDGDIVEEDVAVRRAADRHALARRHEVLTRASASRADDQRGAFGAEVLQRQRASSSPSLGREAIVLSHAGP